GVKTDVTTAGQGFSGDGGPATGGSINISPANLVIGQGTTNQLPETVNIVVGPNGEAIFADTNNNRIRMVGVALVSCVKTGTITISGNNPTPVLTSLNPNTAVAGSGAFTLTANGSGFAPSSIVRWNGQDRTTNLVSSTQLNASINAGDVANAVTAQVTVFTPSPGGGTSSNVPFTVTPVNPVPQITSLSPNSACEGSAGFMLTVNGTGFVNGSVV